MFTKGPINNNGQGGVEEKVVGVGGGGLKIFTSKRWALKIF